MVVVVVLAVVAAIFQRRRLDLSVVVMASGLGVRLAQPARG